jgi:hypothetical protein
MSLKLARKRSRADAPPSPLRIVRRHLQPALPTAGGNNCIATSVSYFAAVATQAAHLTFLEVDMSMGQDKTIIQQVTQRLATRGLRSPCRIEVESKNGEVTLTGNIQYPHQRSAARQAASTAAGVRNVVDRLSIKAPEKRR